LTPADRIFVALDTAEAETALALARRLAGLIGGIKLGKQLFTAEGPAGASKLAVPGLKVFLDLKFHDIPATVAGAVAAALKLRPFMLTVHAAGGRAMMHAAAMAAAKSGNERPLVLGVTVLTSLADRELAEIGITSTTADQVLRLARLAQESGLDGVVCSPLEAKMLRQALGRDFKLVVPGIRPDWAASDDQKRVMTPREAFEAGADYLVIGRPITGAEDPADAARRIAAELG
jgi:orotidine-5'-phosphate decarboxylase